MHLKYRTVIFVWACLLLCGRLRAQEQLHYVYIQSEKGQPFYVKHNGKVLSSTDRGYIIIPRLETGTAPITVGFPNKESKEAQFNLRITKSDQGFLLKQSGEAGYSLYNLQTFRELRSDAGETALAAAPSAPDAVVPELDTAKKEMMSNLQKDLETTFADKAIVTGPSKSAPAKSGNSFASALDKVVVGGDDRDEPEPVPEVKKEVAPAEAVPVATGGEVKKSRKKRNRGERAPLTEEEQAILSGVLAEENKTAASEAAAEEAVKVATGTEEPVKKKSKKRKAKEGDPDFIEFQDDGAPAPVAAATEAAATAPSVVEVPVTTEEEAPARSKKKRKKIFDDTEHPANVITDSSGYGIAITDEEPVKSKKKKKRSDGDIANVDAAGAPVGAEVTEAAPVARKKADARLINSDCVNVMDDDTFRKVLRKFVAARTDNSMIDVFKKQTRNYCLQTAQVKTLVQLLTADDTRYRLLDAAYPKTLDTEKYGSLETLLIDDYYRGRFKAMLHK
ncbi:DUF4476 domain-containing protein [Chitinophaga polysaccharea]|uniref:DUF4476 domain-containing protein n=1 Tax=Chitinophaga polysaccharea TaxID=1293035 RepID=UPI001158520A|nr:DUF4476 domain-containing protein [Chitinophaga polysaccharea]